MRHECQTLGKDLGVMKGDSSPLSSFMMVFSLLCPEVHAWDLSLIRHLFLEFQVALVGKNSLCLFVLGWEIAALPFIPGSYHCCAEGCYLDGTKRDNHSCRMPF